MLRELFTTFHMAFHNSYKGGLNGQLGQNAYYTMMQQCGLLTVKVGKLGFHHFSRVMLYPKITYTAVIYAPGIVQNLQYGSSHLI